jgi:hypothetical protein
VTQKQTPLRLVYAFTIHKAQRQTFQDAQIVMILEKKNDFDDLYGNVTSDLVEPAWFHQSTDFKLDHRKDFQNVFLKQLTC